MEVKIIKAKAVEKPLRQKALNMLTMADIIKGVNAVLNPGKDPVNWFAPDPEAKAAVHIRNGKYDEASSNTAAVFGGDISDRRVEDLKVVAYKGTEGGVYAEGAGTDVTVDGAYISLEGDGSGIGGPSSGAAAKFGASLTLKDAVINTTGRTRYSTAAEEYSTLRVYNSVIWSHGIPFGGDIPAPSALMSTPPPPLEIEGNTRTHCSMSNSMSYFYDSKIICDGWAALSTESSEGYVYLEANDCDIVCTKSGYGAYADPGCHDVFNGCHLDMSNMAAILAGNCDMQFNDCDAVCGTYFALMHCVNGWQEEVGEISIDGGRIAAKKECFIIKSQNALINMNAVDISSEKGILVHTIFNQDPCKTPVNGAVFGVNVNITDMDIDGDLIHEDPERAMWISMVSSSLKGAIINANLRLDKGSRWFATRDSSVVFISDVDPAQINAPSGVTITAQGGEAGEYDLADGGKLVVKA